MEEIRIAGLSKLGYGFPVESMTALLKEKPDVLATDAGSTDRGPFFLATGMPTAKPELSTLRDLKINLKAAVENDIPLIIGSVGQAGGNLQMDWFLSKLNDIIKKEGYHFKLATIRTEFEKGFLKRNIKDIEPLGTKVKATNELIDKSTHIVGQAGFEPIVRALDMGAQVIVCGRACDEVLFAAYPIWKGFDAGLAMHMGKILECGAIAADPGSSSDLLLGVMRKDHFLIRSINPKRKVTTYSVAAHALYEQDNPFLIEGPGYITDLKDAKFEQVDDYCVKVSGSKFVEREHKIKLEGAGIVGYRYMIISSARDPTVIAHIEELIELAKSRTRDNFSELKEGEDYILTFRIYGKNGTMGEMEPVNRIEGHEICLLIESVGRTKVIAEGTCAFAKSVILHSGFEERKSTAGNIAVPISPDALDAGEATEFTLYHLLKCDKDIFKPEIREV